MEIYPFLKISVAILYPQDQYFSYIMQIMFLTYDKQYDKALKLIKYYEEEIYPYPVFRYLYKRVMEKSGRAWWVDK